MLSKNFKHWISCDDPKRCDTCEKMHGKIYRITETPKPKPPLHPFCRCTIKIMEALKAGTVTENKLDGADFWLKYVGYLPDYYISSYAASLEGWKPSKWPSNFVADRTISRGGVSEPGFGWNIFRISLPKSLIIRQYDRVFRLRASKNICSIQNCFALQGEIILLDFEDENFLHTVVFMKFSAKKTENKPVWSEFGYASTA